MNDTRILAVADQFRADCRQERADRRRERWDRAITAATVIGLGVALGSMPWWGLVVA